MSSALICGLSCFLILATLWQDMAGSLAFQGQDIIGGAAVIFKTPKRVKDLGRRRVCNAGGEATAKIWSLFRCRASQ